MKDLMLKKQFVNLRSQGLSLRKISGMLDICYDTAFKWDKKFYVPIQEEKLKQIEEMKEQFCISHKHQPEFLSGHISNI